MKTLRLLLWLRWKLFLGSTTTGSRIGGAVFTLLMIVAFSPAWLGGAIGAYAGVRDFGAAALPLAFGLCQLAWVTLGLLSGALGRSFDLDKFLRYPIRPRTVFSINVVASLLSPTPLMILPTLCAVTVATAQRAGLAAGIGAAAGGLLLMLVTGALLQVLLALLDEALRRESTRYFATAALTLTFVGMQFFARMAVRRLAQDVAMRVLHKELDPQQGLVLANAVFARIPTVAGPAAVVTGALDGSPLRVAGGLVLSLLMLAAAILPGAALMRHTVRGGESVAARPAARRAGRGSFAFGAGLLPPAAALVLRRELLLTLRHPQRLMSMVLAPLVSVVFFFNARSGPNQALIGAGFVLLMMATTLGTASLLLFAYDGPGVRSFFLLPCPPRDVVLAKNIEQLLRLAVQFTLAFGALALISRALWSPLLLTAFVAALAVILCTLAAGTSVSIRHPVRARRRGLTGRGGFNWESQAVSFGTFAGGALVGGAIWLARRTAGAVWADTAGMAVASVALVTGVAVWWRSLDLNARLVVECREKLIETLARSEDD